MGQRANLVIKQNGARRVFYDHWCANRLDIELFWGPVAAITFIEQREEVGEGRWLDDVWCEGAVLIDLDAKKLIFFGGEDILYEPFRRRAFLSLLSDVWRGWTVEWAYEGLLSIADNLSLPRNILLSDLDKKKIFKPFHDNDAIEYNGVLFTLKDGGGVRVTRLSGTHYSFLYGPESLLTHNARLSVEPLRWTGSEPIGGAHIDLIQRELTLWWAQPASELRKRTAEAWGGWSVKWLGDRVEDHLALAGDVVSMPVPPLQERRRNEISRLRARCQFEQTNPAREAMAALRAAGHEVSGLNPATDEARGSVGSLEEKFRLLDALAAR